MATPPTKDLRTRLIKNCIEHGVVLADDAFNLCCAAIADIAMTKPEELHCYVVNAERGVGDSIDRVHPRWEVIARDYVAKLARNDPEAHTAVDELLAKAAVPDAFGRMSPTKIQIPEMVPLEVVIVHDACLRQHPCSACGRTFKSAVNARRCAAGGGSPSGQGAYDMAGLARFWDSLDAASRMQMLPVGLVGSARELPHSEDTAAQITGEDLLEAIARASEGTMLFAIPRGARTVLSGDVRGTMDVDAAMADVFMKQIVAAFALANERELLGLLDAEETEKTRKRERRQKKRLRQTTVKQTRQTKRVVTRLMTDTAFFKQLSLPVSAWWEEEECDVADVLRRCRLE